MFVVGEEEAFILVVEVSFVVEKISNLLPLLTNHPLINTKQLVLRNANLLMPRQRNPRTKEVKRLF